MRLTLSIVLGMALAACGDDGAKTDTSQTTTATTATDATTTEVDEDAPTEDASETDVTVIACETGDTQTVAMAAGGVTLEVCGARLEIPADSLAVGTDITLTAVAPPIPAPFERAFIGPTLQITFDTEFDLTAPWSLHVPDVSSDGGYRTGAVFVDSNDTWEGFEACPEEGGVVFQATFGGTFAYFRDTVIFPETKDGLGDGTLKSTLAGQAEVTWSTDDGYAIHDVSAGGLKSVTVAGRITPDGGQLKQLQIQLTENADHTYTPLEASLIDTAGPAGTYSWLEPVDGDATSANIITVGPRIVGSFVVEARGESGTTTLTIDVDVSTERYRHPPDAACLPEG